MSLRFYVLFDMQTTQATGWLGIENWTPLLPQMLSSDSWKQLKQCFSKVGQWSL